MTTNEKYLEKVRDETVTVTSPILARVAALVVNSHETYAVADNHLARIRNARKTIEGKFAPVLEPMKAALKAAMALFHELDDPLKEGEDTLRAGMKQFRVDEERARQAEIRRQQDEAIRLRREAELKQQAAEKAKTPQMKGRLAAQAEEIEQKAEVAETAPLPGAVVVANSGTRTVKKWRITNVALFVEGVVAGMTPLHMVMIDAVAMNAHFRMAPDQVAQFPGCEVYDDIVVVAGRRG